MNFACLWMSLSSPAPLPEACGDDEGDLEHWSNIKSESVRLGPSAAGLNAANLVLAACLCAAVTIGPESVAGLAAESALYCCAIVFSRAATVSAACVTPFTGATKSAAAGFASVAGALEFAVSAVNAVAAGTAVLAEATESPVNAVNAVAAEVAELAEALGPAAAVGMAAATWASESAAALATLLEQSSHHQ